MQFRGVGKLFFAFLRCKGVRTDDEDEAVGILNRAFEILGPAST